MKKIIVRVTKRLFSLISYIVPKNNRRIILKSVPDFSGNCKALSDYIVNNHKDYEVIWLHKSENTECFLDHNNIKKIRMTGFLWLYYLLTSRFIATTHNEMVGVKAKNQVYISLWHGMPLKKICYLADNEVEYMEDYSAKRIATSEIMKSIIAAAFHEKANNVHITGQPRNDFLFEKKSLSSLGFDNRGEEKVIFYAPTYRHNKYSEKYSNGDKIAGDNIFRLAHFDMEKFNIFLQENKVRIWVKLHPFEEDTLTDGLEFSNIDIIKSEDLKKSELDINHLLYYADCLLTDYSSTYIDYLILDRPIGFVIPDYSKYQVMRGGFTLEPAEYWMPGKKIMSGTELVNFISETVINGRDEFKVTRNNVNCGLNKFSNDNSQRVFKAFIGDYNE